MSKIKLASLFPFCRQLAVAISAGIPLIKAVSLLSEQTSDFKLKTALKSIGNSLDKGSTFTGALETQKVLFPALVIESVRLGESTGRLDITLRELATQLERDYQFRGKIKSAFIYPCLQLFVLVGVICLLTILFAGVKTLLKGAALAATVLAAVYFLLRWAQSISAGRRILQTVKNHIPVIGKLIREIAWARFCRVLSLMVASAMPPDKAIHQAARSANNIFITGEMHKVEFLIRQGNGIAESMLRATSLPDVVKEMISIGEKTGKIDETLEKAAEWYEESVSNTLHVLPKLIAPLIVIIIAPIVGYIIYRVYIVEYLGRLSSIGGGM